ncbi:putative mitochondrial mitochondrial DNA polymerase I protein B, putative (POLIB) [Leptomonas pyrrhocoris]|uniref:Putative mitochondrial mitochondrial DNA polymerase I protein B, putative (POLIB) n=1 Tax=Leptomonas pyrrhocoris TaxID=157538 RepID=A0A0N0DSX1_LEPPY|nr:putative mitochondrial mitochondrial DNA polymerase I protein B, putative (POLIB) [Leptomonas pyrrhocoris]KPA76572.1 putative mitochondrial mitochondrial DNA polymerase I protein B, putative (POLIB) [Leptomonas pyrrhocoris]|eukprot:XP_015655011.1 putative mitochondrial mitochondrial DNA polymerase I protein B, putative (POLIB) [Leptomonas pyrrhocoris]
MRRQLRARWQRVLGQSLRGSCTMQSLVKAQSALMKGKKPSSDAAADYTEFFRVSISLDSGIERSAQEYFESMKNDMAHQQESLTVQEQQKDYAKTADVPIFLVGYHFKSKVFSLYSITADKIVCTVNIGANASDAWGLADDIMLHTGGVSQFILLPVAETTQERNSLVDPLKKLSEMLRSSGLQPVVHVDTLELCSSLRPNPPSPREVTAHAFSGVSPTPLSQTWFQAHWIFLRTAACRAASEDPLRTVSAYILPRFDVYVIHLVRTGSRGLNVSMWDPVRRRHYSAKGMLSDVLACLFDTRSTRMILLPTNRTDRASLFRCRAAVTKSGNRCVVVFASEVSEAMRGAYQSSPSRYWETLKEAAKWLDADLLFNVYITAGNTLRAYQKKALADSKERNYLEQLAPTQESTIATPQNVSDWAKYFTFPKRVAAERAEARHYTKYIAVSFIATDNVVYAQPMNPVARQNYVLSACLSDHAGRTVEPWSVYSGRGQFCLPKLDDYEVLVTHDAKTFLLLLWQDVELQKFLKRGGRVWCVTLAEYLLEAQRCVTGKNGLGELALRHGALLPSASRVGTANDRLPFAFQRRFLLLATPVVLKIFHAQLTRSCEQCQMMSLAHRMDSLLAMASMEWAGIHIDAEEATRQAASLRNAAAVLDRTLAGYIPPEVPQEMHELFDWRSLQQTHALFFGGTINLGYNGGSRDNPLWTSNLVHLCHKYGDFTRMVGELHLQRYAALCSLPLTTKLPQRVASFIDEQGTQKTKTYRMVFFDVETTGLNPATDAIVEIALFDPVENTTFHTLVNPQRVITPRTVSIHHITNALVRDAPTMETVAPSIGEYLRLDKASYNPDEVLVMVGHNVFGVDEPLLRRAIERHAPDVQLDGVLFCDSLTMLVALRSDVAAHQNTYRMERHVADALVTSLRLGSLMTTLKVRPEGELHRAITDTRALWYVLLHAFGLTGEDPVAQRDALLAFAANTLLRYPSKGCFVATDRKNKAIKLRLPGIASAYIKNSKLVASLQHKVFSEAVLASLSAHGVKPASLLLQRQVLERHVSSFLQPNSDGRLATLHPDGCVHQHIDMTATTTSRTVSAHPSCQNIPKDDKSSVRRLFVSRFGAQGRCVEVDYSQLEIVVLANLCNDANLSRDLNKGVDFHVKRAAFFSGLPYKEIYQGYKRDVPKYVKLRKTAKQFSFQRLYGAGVPLLHKTTGISVKDLESSIKQENEEYPSIAEFHRIVRSVALRPNNPGLPTCFIAEMPTGLRMSFRTRDVVLNLPPIKNYPIQGYGAELAQMMLGRLFRHFVKKNFYKDRACLINFVHDSVWIDCHVDVLEQCVTDTCRILSSVHEYVPKTFPGVKVSVPLHVSASCGVDMCSMQTIKDGDYSFVAMQKKSKVAEVGDFLDLSAKSTLSSAVAESMASPSETEGEGEEEVIVVEETRAAAQ